jgi:rod shape-determining protein MreC
VATSRPRSTRLLVVVLVSVSLAVITLDYRQGEAGPLAGAGRAVRSAMAPLQEAVTTVTRPIGDFFRGLAHLPSLERENAELNDKVDDYETRIAQSEELQGRYEDLLDLLGLRQTLDPTAVPAVVIANGVSNFEWTVTIDRGSDDGIAVDMPVVAGDASAARLVGHVVAVTGNSSVVQLIIDTGHAVAGRLEGRDVGLVRGQGDEDMVMELVDPGSEIDLTGGPVEVFTMSYEVNGQQGRYPPGLLIGEVSRVFEGENQLETSVSVRPAVNFASLEYVLVLRLEGRTDGPATEEPA